MSPQFKQLLIAMYGLGDKYAVAGPEVARKIGIPVGSIYYREKQAFEDMGVTLSTNK